MFSWLWSLFSRSKSDYSIDSYTPGERFIYRYFDGQKKVAADPMVLHKRVMDRGPELAIDMKVSASSMKGNKDAHEAMLRKIREIFDVKPFNEGGLTEAECVELLDHFLTYEDFQKKMVGTPPTTPTAPSSATPPSSGGGPPTGSTTPSDSTPSGPPTGEPTTSPTASESPSEPSNPDSTTTSP